MKLGLHPDTCSSLSPGLHTVTGCLIWGLKGGTTLPTNPAPPGTALLVDLCSDAGPWMSTTWPSPELPICVFPLVAQATSEIALAMVEVAEECCARMWRATSLFCPHILSLWCEKQPQNALECLQNPVFVFVLMNCTRLPSIHANLFSKQWLGSTPAYFFTLSMPTHVKISKFLCSTSLPLGPFFCALISLSTMKSRCSNLKASLWQISQLATRNLGLPWSPAAWTQSL